MIKLLEVVFGMKGDGYCFSMVEASTPSLCFPLFHTILPSTVKNKQPLERRDVWLENSVVCPEMTRRRVAIEICFSYSDLSSVSRTLIL